MTEELPELPERLPPLAAEHVVTLPVTTRLVRVHLRTGRHAREYHELRYLGPLPGHGRFDHHPTGSPPRPADHFPNHGALYAACDDPRAAANAPEGGGSVPGNVLDVVVAELVQSGVELQITPGLTLSVFTPAAPLLLLDARTWGQSVRAGTHLSTAPHHRVQPWARAIRSTYPQLHGVLYVPATGGRAVSVVLNELANAALTDAGLLMSRSFDDPALLGIIMDVAKRLNVSITMNPTA